MFGLTVGLYKEPVSNIPSNLFRTLASSALLFLQLHAVHCSQVFRGVSCNIRCPQVTARRSQNESKLSMHVKDSMREHSIVDVAAAWYVCLLGLSFVGIGGAQAALLTISFLPACKLMSW